MTPDWSQALCAQTDPDLFAPEWGDTFDGMYRDALRICNGWPKRGMRPCDIRAECLAWALENDERGIWGGKTDTQRRGSRKRRAA